MPISQTVLPQKQELLLSMKPAIKSNSILLSLIPIFGILGCTSTGQSIENTVDQATRQQAEIPAVVTPQEQPYYSIPSDIQTGRYSSIKSQPTQSQRELLQVMITVSIPDEITSIGETIAYLLKRSGYQLMQPEAKQIELTKFFLKRLPDVHRHIGPMTLEDALTILTSPAFKLNIDPVRRLISYELDKQYAGEIL
ncbi:MAG: hypothetical protein QM500_07775 [Methylococcales bacterium]